MTALDDLADALVIASRALVGIAVHSIAASPVEVTVPQYRLLVLVASEGERTVGEIATRLGVNQSNASRQCDRLQDLGLLARRRSSSDGRVVKVQLTEAGTTVLETVIAQRRADVRGVLEGLTVAQAAGALDGLRAFNRAADEREDVHWVTHLW